MSENTKIIAKKLLEVLEESELFKKYIRLQEIVKNDSALFAKITEIRELNLKLQTEQNSDRVYEEQDWLEKRYDELSSDPRVYDFIQTESDFIKLYQEINQIILDKVQFI